MTHGQASEIAFMLREYNGISILATEVQHYSHQYMVICGSEGDIHGCIRSVPGYSGVTWIRHLCVKPECRGKGYGKTLVNMIPKTGFTLAMVKETNGPSLSVFKSCGYTEVSRSQGKVLLRGGEIES